MLVPEDEARNTLELDDIYVIQPSHSWCRRKNWNGAHALPDGFRYTSDCNPEWLTPEELRELIAAGSPAVEKSQVA